MIPTSLRNKTCEERVSILLAQLSEDSLKQLDTVLAEQKIVNILNNDEAMQTIKKLLPILFKLHPEREIVFTLKRWGLGNGFILI